MQATKIRRLVAAVALATSVAMTNISTAATFNLETAGIQEIQAAVAIRMTSRRFMV